MHCDNCGYPVEGLSCQNCEEEPWSSNRERWFDNEEIHGEVAVDPTAYIFSKEAARPPIDENNQNDLYRENWRNLNTLANDYVVTSLADFITQGLDFEAARIELAEELGISIPDEDWTSYCNKAIKLNELWKWENLMQRRSDYGMDNFPADYEESPKFTDDPMYNGVNIAQPGFNAMPAEHKEKWKKILPWLFTDDENHTEYMIDQNVNTYTAARPSMQEDEWGHPTQRDLGWEASRAMQKMDMPIFGSVALYYIRMGREKEETFALLTCGFAPQSFGLTRLPTLEEWDAAWQYAEEFNSAENSFKAFAARPPIPRNQTDLAHDANMQIIDLMRGNSLLSDIVLNVLHGRFPNDSETLLQECRRRGIYPRKDEWDEAYTLAQDAINLWPDIETLYGEKTSARPPQDPAQIDIKRDLNWRMNNDFPWYKDLNSWPYIRDMAESADSKEEAWAWLQENIPTYLIVDQITPEEYDKLWDLAQINVEYINWPRQTNENWRQEYQYHIVPDVNKKRCETCSAFRERKCLMFNEAEVTENGYCTEWSQTWTKDSSLEPRWVHLTPGTFIPRPGDVWQEDDSVWRPLNAEQAHNMNLPRFFDTEMAEQGDELGIPPYWKKDDGFFLGKQSARPLITDDQQEMGLGRKIVKVYSPINPQYDFEAGDVSYDDIDEEEFDFTQEMEPIEEAATLLINYGFTDPSSSVFHVGIWYTEPDRSEDSAHLEGWTPQEEQQIWQILHDKKYRHYQNYYESKVSARPIPDSGDKLPQFLSPVDRLKYMENLRNQDPDVETKYIDLAFQDIKASQSWGDDLKQWYFDQHKNTGFGYPSLTWEEWERAWSIAAHFYDLLETRILPSALQENDSTKFEKFAASVICDCGSTQCAEVEGQYYCTNCLSPWKYDEGDLSSDRPAAQQQQYNINTLSARPQEPPQDNRLNLSTEWQPLQEATDWNREEWWNEFWAYIEEQKYQNDTGDRGSNPYPESPTYICPNCEKVYDGDVPDYNEICPNCGEKLWDFSDYANDAAEDARQQHFRDIYDDQYDPPDYGPDQITWGDIQRWESKVSARPIPDPTEQFSLDQRQNADALLRVPDIAFVSQYMRNYDNSDDAYLAYLSDDDPVTDMIFKEDWDLAWEAAKLWQKRYYEEKKWLNRQTNNVADTDSPSRYINIQIEDLSERTDQNLDWLREHDLCRNCQKAKAGLTGYCPECNDARKQFMTLSARPNEEPEEDWYDEMPIEEGEEYDDDEPQSDDVIIYDASYYNGYQYTFGNTQSGRFEDWADVLKDIEKEMEKQGYYPNVWYNGDTINVIEELKEIRPKYQVGEVVKEEYATGGIEWGEEYEPGFKPRNFADEQMGFFNQHGDAVIVRVDRHTDWDYYYTIQQPDGSIHDCVPEEYIQPNQRVAKIADILQNDIADASTYTTDLHTFTDPTLPDLRHRDNDQIDDIEEFIDEQGNVHFVYTDGRIYWGRSVDDIISRNLLHTMTTYTQAALSGIINIETGQVIYDESTEVNQTSELKDSFLFALKRTLNTYAPDGWYKPNDDILHSDEEIYDNKLH